MLLFKKILVLTLFANCTFNSEVWGQQAGQTPQQKPPLNPTGTITEIKEQGRNKVAVVTNDQGQTLEITLGKIPVDIKAAGDTGFVREGVYIGAEAVFTNEMLFISELSVRLPVKGQKSPRGKIAKAPREAGNSQNTYQVMGTILALKQNPDYPDYTMLAIDAPGKNPVINLEKTYTVKVVAMDSELLTVGMEVELEGRVNRGKFLPSKINVNRSEPFKSEEIFAAEKE